MQSPPSELAPPDSTIIRTGSDGRLRYSPTQRQELLDAFDHVKGTVIKTGTTGPIQPNIHRAGNPGVPTRWVESSFYPSGQTICIVNNLAGIPYAVCVMAPSNWPSCLSS